VRRQPVTDAVARQEGYPTPVDASDRDRSRRSAPGRLHLELLYIVEECVEPGSAEHADIGARSWSFINVHESMSGTVRASG
jgi:hypothetical protein